MRWLGRITTEENLEIRKTQVNKCKRNKNEKYKNDLRYFDKQGIVRNGYITEIFNEKYC